MKGVFNLVIFMALLFSIFGAFVSYELYSFTHKGISAHASGNGEVNLTVEGSNSVCGDILCNGAETCSTCASDCGVCSTGGAGGASGGGGGGGGSPATASTPKFTIDSSNVNLQIVSGNSESNELVIKNTGTIPITLSVLTSGLEQFIVFEDLEIILAPGESKSLIYTVHAPEPGVYAGKIILGYKGINQEVLILLNVVSEGVLFDATVTVPDLYRVLRAGQRLPVLVELTEVGGGSGVDVTMNYVIKDFNNDIIYTESETFYVEGTKSYSKRFSTNGLEAGDYILGVELVYSGGFATSSAHFKISETVLTLQTWLAIIGIFVAIIIVGISIVFFKKRQGHVPKLRKSSI